MKKYIILLNFFLLLSSNATVEDERGFDYNSSPDRLSFVRSCFKETRKLGCGHPREDHIFFKNCIQKYYDRITPKCKMFFDQLYFKTN